MKLYVRTPSDTGLGLNVILTGQVQEEDGLIHRVEVILPIGCDLVVGYVEAPPKSMGPQLLWANPGDLCSEDASGVTRHVRQDQLRAEIRRVNERRRADMERGPLGDNWP